MHEMVLPNVWRTVFDGTALDEKLSTSALLATADGEGWPHVSFLSAGEVLIMDADGLMLTIWGTSTTASNMRQSRRAAFFAVADHVVVEARLAIEACRADEGGRAVFTARVKSLRSHPAPYAEVDGMIAFRLLDPAGTLDRWRAQIAAMREHG